MQKLLLLPDWWWDLLADLWCKCIALGRVPPIWAHARVILLEKPGGAFGPLSIVSAIWRAGASVVASMIGPWLQAMAPAELAGGLPARSAAHVHARMHTAVQFAQDRALRGDATGARLAV